MVAGTALQQNSVVNSIKLTPAPSFNVIVANQGQNDETGVVVELKIEGAPGTTPLITKKTINIPMASFRTRSPSAWLLPT